MKKENYYRFSGRLGGLKNNNKKNVNKHRLLAKHVNSIINDAT